MTRVRTDRDLSMKIVVPSSALPLQCRSGACTGTAIYVAAAGKLSIRAIAGHRALLRSCREMTKRR